MVESFHVHVLDPARRDIQLSLDFIAARSPAGAQSWQDALLAALERLKASPLAFGYAPENIGAEENIRQILFSTRSGLTYRAIYTVVERDVRILRVRGPGQDLLDRQPF